MTEKEYPIYSFEVKIPIPTFAPDCPSFHFEGLDDGWQWETFSKQYMYREELLESEEIDVLSDYVDSCIKGMDKKGQVYDIDKMTSKITYQYHSTWCGTWFSHFTFDEGQTDNELLESFDNYIHIVEQHNRELRYETGEENSKGSISLMGAEDRWRWYGTTDGNSDNRTDAPCRCEHCKERGILTIGH